MQAPEVTGSAPDNSELAQAMSDMNANIASVLQAQKEDRQQLGELTAKLLLSEEEKNQLLREFALAEERYQADLATAEANAATNRAATENSGLITPDTDVGDRATTSNNVNTETADLLVQAINGILTADGYSSLRLQAGVLGDDKASLKNVTWMSWGRDGLADSVIRADILEFELHQMTSTLVLRFFEGDRVADGSRTPLPANGLRLDLEDVSAQSWQRLLPGLLDSAPAVAAIDSPADPPVSVEQAVVPVSSAPLSAKVVRKSLDDLISNRGSFSYYRLNALGSIDGKILKMVQINWHDNSGRLVKTIEADTLEVILHPGGSVELLLRNGAFLDDGVKSPFSSDRFRLHLPSQDLNSWRSSGVPYTESDH